MRAALWGRLPIPLPKGAPPAVDWGAIEWIGPGPFSRAPGLVGALAGNPHSGGRRYTYLALGENDEPLYIAKVGFEDAARARIRRERDFLASQSTTGRAGIPDLWGTLETAAQSGLIMPFFDGRFPDWHLGKDCPDGVLVGWISDSGRVPLAQIPAWAALSQIKSCATIMNHKVYPVIHHGDFAPWNILVGRDGSWRIIDWERGSSTGVPGWDWFHFVIQPALLVERVVPLVVAKRIDALLKSSAFAEYALRTEIAGNERALLTGYLHHAQRLLRDNVEGSDAERLRRGLSALLG